MPNPLPPLSLYIHLPWCVQKCPYCDFNSHAQKGALPEALYVAALMDDLDLHVDRVKGREIVSIFFGGGTPSLFSATSIGAILEGVAKRLSLSPTIEITLEANPGTVDEAQFHGFHQAGINRLSLGLQSLQDDKLKTLGRIHGRDDALRAVQNAKKAGFTNFNLDLMYGLPQQTIADALHDIKLALQCEPTHLSWYQLTIEPNTLFHHHRPTLPNDDYLWDMQEAGITLIHQSNFAQYEISAYARDRKECLHNRNYWEFGDYIGIGAGAHGKITDANSNIISRFAQTKNPRDYLDAAKRRALARHPITPKDLPFEFMLNALRLTDGVATTLFTERTGLPLSVIQSELALAKERGLMEQASNIIKPTLLGKKFLNDLMGMFL